jgi:hypothetical protein
LADVIPEEDREFGYLSLLDPNTSIENLPVAATNAFTNATLFELCQAKVIVLSDYSAIMDGSGNPTTIGNMKLLEFINYSLNIMSHGGFLVP